MPAGSLLWVFRQKQSTLTWDSKGGSGWAGRRSMSGRQGRGGSDDKGSDRSMCVATRGGTSMAGDSLRAPGWLRVRGQGRRSEPVSRSRCWHSPPVSSHPRHQWEQQGTPHVARPLGLGAPSPSLQGDHGVSRPGLLPRLGQRKPRLPQKPGQGATLSFH